MFIVFNPKDSDLEEVQLPMGGVLLKMKRGEPRDIPEPIAKRILEHSPELYEKAEAPPSVAKKAGATGPIAQ